MKKFKIIGLSILLAIFIAGNFMISFSLNKDTDSSLNLLYNQARADSEPYGNGMNGACYDCILYDGEGNPVQGGRIICWTWPYSPSYCIPTECNLGAC